MSEEINEVIARLLNAYGKIFKFYSTGWSKIFKGCFIEGEKIAIKGVE